MNGLDTSFRHHFFGPEGWGAVLCLLGAVFFGWYASVDWRLDRALAERGVVATGTVTDREEHSVSASTSNGRRLWYSFATASGEVVEGEQRVGRQLYIHAREGQARQVTYLPDDPGRNAIDPGQVIANALHWLLYGAGCLVAAVVLGVMAGRKARVSRAKYRDGVVRLARVVRHEPSGRKTRKDVEMFLAHWQDDFGGSGTIGPAIRSFLPPEGNTVRMLVDPAGRWPAERLPNVVPPG